MILTRGWLLVVALVAAAAAALAFSLPRMAQRDVDAQVAARLANVAQSAELELSLYSRRWIDATARAASDAMLSESMDQATRGGMSADLIHRTIQERLQKWGGEWKAYQVIAVDGHGRVLARAGADEEEWKDDLTSAPVVVEALRGYRIDDTWDVGGKLYLVAATPVIYHERYAGALVVLQEMGGVLLDGLAETLGVEAALLVDGKVVAKSKGGKLLDGTPPLVREHAQELAEHGRSEPSPVRLGGEAQPTHAMVALALPGESESRSAALVLVGDRPRLGALPEVASRLRPEQLSPQDLAPIAAALLGALLLGLIFTWLEHGRPLGNLLQAVQAVSRGDAPHVVDRNIGGRFGAVARLVNAAIDRVKKEAPRAAAPLSLEPSAGSFVRGAVEHSAGIELPSEPTYVPPPAPYAGAAQPTYPPPPSAVHPLSSTMSAIGLASHPASSPPRPADVPTWAPPEAPLESPPWASAPVMPSLMPASSTAGFGEPSSGAGMLSNLDEISGVRSVFPSSAPSRSSFRNDNSGLHSAGYSSNDPMLASGGASYSDSPYGGAPYMGGDLYPPPAEPPPPEPAPPLDPIEQEFGSVFQDFIDTRQRCGEPTDGVTFDKFAAKLRANREQLIARYKCQQVKFQVYVKDGKAALKATPVM